MQEEKLQLELERLGQKIEGLEKPVLMCERKSSLKNGILEKIAIAEKCDVNPEFAGVVGYIGKILTLFKLDLVKRVEIKERIFSAIESVPQKSFFFRNFFVFNKKLISGFVAMALFFGMFSYVRVDTSVVMAQSFTILESFSGDVEVLRGGEELEIVSGMELFEGDLIFTHEDGNAVVRYFDDSVTRLSSNTRISINKLFKVYGKVNTYVEVALENGMVWSRVVNPMGGDSSFVLKARDVETTAQKAAFNTSFDDGKIEVEVFNSSVDVKKGNEVEKIVRGQKAVVNGDVRIVVLSDGDSSADWVKNNLESDRIYLTAAEDRLLDAKIQRMGEDVSIGKSFREDVAIFLTFNDIERKKKELDIAEKNLIAAEIKLSKKNLSDKDKEDIEFALKDFANKAKEFGKTVKEVGYSDEKYSGELKDFLDNKILVHQKELVGIMPGSNFYEVKTLIDEVSLFGAVDESEFVEKKLNQVSERLAVAENAVVLGQEDVAKSILDDLKGELNGVNEMISEMRQNAPNLALSLVPKVDEVQRYLMVVGEKANPSKVVIEKDMEIVVDGVVVEGLVVEEELDVEVADSDVSKNQYGIYVKGDKLLPSEFAR